MLPPFAAFRSAALILALVCGVLPPRADTTTQLKQFSVKANGHIFAVWARIPDNPRGAILLLHGRTWSSLPDFDLQVPGLNRSVMVSLAARGFAAYALDQRGYGETPRDETGWINPRQAVEDANAVLSWIADRHAQLPKPALLGWSLGGATAHLVAIEHPGSLSAVILYGYAPDPDAVILPVTAPSAPSRDRNTPQAAASDFMSPKVTEEAVVREFVKTAVRTDPVHVDWKDEEQFVCDSAHIGVPVLILYGERDPNVDEQEMRHFYSHLSAAEKQYVMIPGADHCAHLESTHDAWVSAVVNFLLRPGVHATAAGAKTR